MGDGFERTILGQGFEREFLSWLFQMINLLLILFRDETFEDLQDGFLCNEVDKCEWFKR